MVPHRQGSLRSGQPGHQLTSSFAMQEPHPWGGGLLLLLAQAYASGGGNKVFVLCLLDVLRWQLEDWPANLCTPLTGAWLAITTSAA